ncbi:MAG: CHASE3 domain-containing protein [Nitrosomonadales bacterium]
MIHKIIVAIAGAVLLITLGLILVFWSLRQIEEASEVRQHTNTLLFNADELLTSLNDAETGQRGYLLTGDSAFLEPYLAVRNSIRRRLDQLRLMTLNSPARNHLDVISPLIDAKLAELSHTIELRRNQDLNAALAVVRSGLGKNLMDSIRAEMGFFIQAEENERKQNDAKFASDMRRMFSLIMIASLLTILFALAFAYLIYRGTQQRLKNLVHLETQHLLEIQESTNKKLIETNITLQVSEEKFAVTLNSIGDAVIATDATGRVTFLNPLAEQFTGWTLTSAIDHPVEEIFRIVNKETRQPATIPVTTTLAHGTIQGLANHTVLIAQDGSECDIADSCAPIRDRDGRVIGAVLVFRDVTEEYAAQQTLRDNAALIQDYPECRRRWNCDP